MSIRKYIKYEYIQLLKEHIHKLKVMQSMSLFGGLWKHQNNPACTGGRGGGVILVLTETAEVGHY